MNEHTKAPNWYLIMFRGDYSSAEKLTEKIIHRLMRGVYRNRCLQIDEQLLLIYDAQRAGDPRLEIEVIHEKLCEMDPVEYGGLPGFKFYTILVTLDWVRWQAHVSEDALTYLMRP